MFRVRPTSSAPRINQDDRRFAGVSLPRFQRNLLQRRNDRTLPIVTARVWVPDPARRMELGAIVCAILDVPKNERDVFVEQLRTATVAFPMPGTDGASAQPVLLDVPSGD